MRFRDKYAWQYLPEMISPPSTPVVPRNDVSVQAGFDTVAGSLTGLNTKVQVREVDIKQLSDDDFLPSTLMDEEAELLQLLVTSVGVLIGIICIGAAFSNLLEQASANLDFAIILHQNTKRVLGGFELLLLARGGLVQFPRINSTKMPWALIYYSTEWLLAPARTIIKPDAGLDVLPFVFLGLTTLAHEFLCGPAGLLTNAMYAVNRVHTV